MPPPLELWFTPDRSAAYRDQGPVHIFGFFALGLDVCMTFKGKLTFEDVI